MARWELSRRRHRYLEANRGTTYDGDHPLTRSGECHESAMHAVSFGAHLEEKASPRIEKRELIHRKGRRAIAQAALKERPSFRP